MCSRTLTLPNGRQLGYATEGTGCPVIYFHGTASSRLEILLLKQFAYTHNFQLIGIDRPGYGLSTYTERFNFKDFAADVNFVADYLKLTNFAVLSWSGGGPFALVYTALYGNRVTCAVTVGAPSLPFDPSIAHNNNPLAKYAMSIPIFARLGLHMFRKLVISANQDIVGYLDSSHGKRMINSWPPPDVPFFSNPDWLQLMYAAVAEGFRQNGDSINAIYQEHRLFLKPLTDPLWQIPANKLTIWQGAQDKTCPADNGQKIAQTIKGAHVELFPNEGHCVMFAHPQKLAKALAPLC